MNGGGICKPCLDLSPEVCGKCNSLGICEFCIKGYFLKETNYCESCETAYCEECDAFSCITCQVGYALINNVCKLCS